VGLHLVEVGSVVELLCGGMVDLVVVDTLAAVAGSSVLGTHTVGAMAPGLVGMVAIGVLALVGRRFVELVLEFDESVELVPAGSRHRVFVPHFVIGAWGIWPAGGLGFGC